MRHPHDLRDPIEMIRHQKRTAAHGDQGHISRLGLDPVHRLLNHTSAHVEDAAARHPIQVCHPRRVTQVEFAGGHRNIAGGKLFAAEY